MIKKIVITQQIMFYFIKLQRQHVLQENKIFTYYNIKK